MHPYRVLRLIVLATATLALPLALPGVAQAASGDLDPTFGTGGKVTTDFNGNDDEAHGLVIQADGKLVAAGFAKTSRGEDFALARYNPNGTLDTTFGTGGKVTTDFNGGDDQAFALVLQGDGKLVAAGTTKAGFTYNRTGEDFALARYLG